MYLCNICKLFHERRLLVMMDIMRISLLFLLIITAGLPLSAQNSFGENAAISNDTIDRRVDSTFADDNRPKDEVDVLNRKPQFPGGNDSLNAFIKSTLRYPKKAVKVRAEGRVVLRFTVTPKGDIKDIFILRGLYYPCDEEAVYIVRNMPKWIPGLQDGKPVAMQVIIPVEFVPPKLN